MNYRKSAFPLAYKVNNTVNVSDGMALREYAAIHLKVPRSRDPDIDAMIWESRRAEFAKAALTGNVFGSHVHDCQGVAEECFDVANYMLAEWEKEAERGEN
jgi:hypothetical protein